MSTIRQNSIEILDQLGSLVNRLPGEIYSRPLSCLQDNSIGKHVRHMLEFFGCLLEGIELGEVNYDLRRRNLLIETDPHYTLVQIGSIQGKLPEVQDGDLLLKADMGTGIQSFQTSVFRELAFTLDHCLHHLAIIRIAMQQHCREIPLEENLGVAFSTLRYLQEKQA
jgi:hypothetical protein